MKIKRLAVLLLCFSFLLSLFGCGKGDRFILDGPGMVNPYANQPPAAWDGFTVTQSASFSQYNFWFTVERKDGGLVLSGECQDEEGEYLQIEGVQLFVADAAYIEELGLGELQDDTPDSDGIMIDGILIEEPLDAPSVNLTLHCPDGSNLKKQFGSDGAMELYYRFLPYFKNN